MTHTYIDLKIFSLYRHTFGQNRGAYISNQDTHVTIVKIISMKNQFEFQRCKMHWFDKNTL